MSELTVPEALAIADAKWAHWRQHNVQLARFEQWQNEPDEDYTFSAIRVAVLLIRYREEQNAKLHREEIN